MATGSFDEFVKSEHEGWRSSKDNEMDWQAVRNEWLAKVEDLFDLAKGFLQPYVDSKQIVISYKSAKLNEQYLGAYTTKEMVITIGAKTVKLEPVGRLIIGSRGRVDMVGPAGRAVLVLLDKEIKQVSQLIHVSVGFGGKTPQPPKRKPESEVKAVWRIMARPPNRAIIELSRETFFNLVMEVANG